MTRPTPYFYLDLVALDAVDEVGEALRQHRERQSKSKKTPFG